MDIDESINSFANAINSYLNNNLSDDDNSSSDDYFFDNDDLFLDEDIEIQKIKENRYLNEKHIKLLNNINLKKEKFCSISQENFKGNAIKLPCKHIFKKKPIINYLLKYNNRCPICRGEITEYELKKIYNLKKKVLKSLIKEKKKNKRNCIKKDYYIFK